MFPAGSGGGPLRRHPTTQEVTITAGFQFIRGCALFGCFVSPKPGIPCERSGGGTLLLLCHPATQIGLTRALRITPAKGRHVVRQGG